jgi:hypothetical protein
MSPSETNNVAGLASVPWAASVGGRLNKVIGPEGGRLVPAVHQAAADLADRGARAWETTF